MPPTRVKSSGRKGEPASPGSCGGGRVALVIADGAGCGIIAVVGPAEVLGSAADRGADQRAGAGHGGVGTGRQRQDGVAAVVARGGGAGGAGGVGGGRAGGA